MVNLSDDLFGDAPARVDVSSPRRALARLNAQAKAAGKSRADHIAEMALHAKA